MTQSREREESEAKFKVVDRRRFNDEGETRPDAALEDASGAAMPPQASPSEFGQSQHLPPPGPISFSIFIQSLAQQSLMAMGLIPWPDTGLVEARFEHARETIDVLSMLREKTKGNLSPEEQRFFDTLLYELRMTFVQVLQGNMGDPQTEPPNIRNE